MWSYWISCSWKPGSDGRSRTVELEKKARLCVARVLRPPDPDGLARRDIVRVGRYGKGIEEKCFGDYQRSNHIYEYL